MQPFPSLLHDVRIAICAIRRGQVIHDPHHVLRLVLHSKDSHTFVLASSSSMLEEKTLHLPPFIRQHDSPISEAYDQHVDIFQCPRRVSVEAEEVACLVIIVEGGVPCQRQKPTVPEPEHVRTRSSHSIVQEGLPQLATSDAQRERQRRAVRKRLRLQGQR
jgi:hypothetical protein